MAEAISETLQQEREHLEAADPASAAPAPADTPVPTDPTVLEEADPVAVVLPAMSVPAAHTLSASPEHPATIDVVTSGVGVSANAVYLFGWSRADLRRAVALLLTGSAALYFLWQVQSILPPFLIAFFLAALLDPTIRYYERKRGYSRVRTISLLYMTVILLTILCFILLVPRVMAQLQDVTQNFGLYYANVQNKTNQFLQKNEKTLARLNLNRERLSQIVDQKSGPIRNAITRVLEGFTGMISNMASYALWLIVIPIAGFFFMRDYPAIRARFITLAPEPYQDRVDLISRDIMDVFSAYIRGLAKICALFGFAAFLLFTLFGVRYALLLGILAGTFYAIPYVGQLVTAFVVGAVAYSMGPHTVLFAWNVEANSILYAVVVVLSNILMNNIFDQVVYPFVVGSEVGIHPLLNIFALTAGATLLGIWGMLLAVPIAASIQLILVYCFPRLKEPPPAHLMEASPRKT